MIVYSDSTIVDTTFVSNGTRLQLVQQWEAAVAAAGWSAVSGTGGSNVVYDSASFAGFKCRVRMKDPGSGNCSQNSMINGLFNLETPPFFQLPTNGVNWRIWANKYQFFMYRIPLGTVGREFVYAGVPWMPDFMLDSMTGPGFNYAGLSTGVGTSDTDGSSITQSWRRTLDNGFCASCWRGSVFMGGNISIVGEWGSPNSFSSGLAYPQWNDGTFHMKEPLIASPFGTNGSGTPTIHGQLWDSMVITRPFSDGQIRIIGGQKWRSFTSDAINPSGSGTLRGSLMLLTTQNA